MKLTDLVLLGVVAYALYRMFGQRAARFQYAGAGGSVQRVVQVSPDFITGQGAAAPGMTWEWDEIEGAWNQRPALYPL